MNFLGIDASLTATGVALRTPETWSTWTLRSNPAMAPVVRYRQIASRLFSAIHDLDPANTIAVLEKQFVPPRATGHGSTLLMIAELRGVILYGLDARGFPVAEPTPTCVKRWATGRGNASKALMLDAARRSLPEFGSSNDDEADAAWMCWLAIRTYAPNTLPVHHEVFRAGDAPGVRWPNLPSLSKSMR